MSLVNLGDGNWVVAKQIAEIRAVSLGCFDAPMFNKFAVEVRLTSGKTITCHRCQMLEAAQAKADEIAQGINAAESQTLDEAPPL